MLIMEEEYVGKLTFWFGFPSTAVAKLFSSRSLRKNSPSTNETIQNSHGCILSFSRHGMLIGLEVSHLRWNLAIWV
jgi:hypothetical protein